MYKVYVSDAQVLVDGYTRGSVLPSGASIYLGCPLILICRVVGLPYGTPLSYTWTCPNGPCEVEGYYGRKVYNEHILAVNTTSTSDGGTYTCQVTATEGQEATGSFILTVTGMCVCLTTYNDHMCVLYYNRYLVQMGLGGSTALSAVEQLGLLSMLDG